MRFIEPTFLVGQDFVVVIVVLVITCRLFSSKEGRGGEGREGILIEGSSHFLVRFTRGGKGF